MKKICSQCNDEMVTDCKVQVEGGMYGLKITRKVKGLFKKVTVKPKAAVCPNCGYIAFYTDDFRQFK